MSFLGIDLGTSFLKGAVLNLEARRPEHVRRTPFPPPLENAGPLHCEFDCDAVLAAVRALIAELAPFAPDCEGVVMCSQMHGLVLLDHRGVAASNCITWRDERALLPHPSGAGSYFEVLTRRLKPQHIKQLGNELDPGRPICYLFWMAERGELSPGLTPVSVPAFVLSALCDSPPGEESTNAAAFSALNLETLTWHEEAIAALGLEKLRWPAMRKQGEVVGSLPLNGKPVPCYAPVGDYQCALVGALFGTEEISLNIATGSQVSRMMPGLQLGDFQTRPFFDGRFLITFTGAPAGRALNVLVDLLCDLAKAPGGELPDPWTLIARTAAAVQDTDLNVDLHFFGPPRPGRGQITNIRGNNLTSGHLFRGAFNNMADNYFDLALRLWPERGWKNLLLSGGLASKLGVLRETIQKRFACDYRIAPVEEDTLFGLLILASVFSGRANSVEELTRQIRETLSDRQA